MAEPYLSEIRIMSFNFAPKGWAPCNGQWLRKSLYQALFELLGYTFGGVGDYFALPDLRGRTPVHFGSGHVFGEKGGEQLHTLTGVEFPAHTHYLQLSNNPGDPKCYWDYMLSNSGEEKRFTSSGTNLVSSDQDNIGSSVLGQGHPNMQPFLPLKFCIALQGIYPT